MKSDVESPKIIEKGTALSELFLTVPYKLTVYVPGVSRRVCEPEK